jgi:hypothetical protein
LLLLIVAAAVAMVAIPAFVIMPFKDYWGDWKIYHPDTKVYSLGEMAPQSKR